VNAHLRKKLNAAPFWFKQRSFCGIQMVMIDVPNPGVTSKLINALYVEAMVLADEARAYFDLHSRESRDQMTPLQRVSFSCESLKVTTRLMHIVAWLLTQRAMAENAPAHRPFDGTVNHLGNAAPTDSAIVATLPDQARDLILASSELYRRVQRLDQQLISDIPRLSPVQSLQSRLAEAF
jgi:regulator of CtrA degradation